MTCKFEGCQRARAYADQPFCLMHRLRWAPSRPVEVREPRWLAWTREHQNAKDLSGGAA